MNNVVLVGRTTKPVELRKTKDDTSYARFTLAVPRRFDKDQTDFINCVAWRKTADLVNTYVNKGDRVGVTGSIQTGSYVDRDGKKVYTTDVLVDSVEFLEPKNTVKAEQPEPQDPPEPQAPKMNIDELELPF